MTPRGTERPLNGAISSLIRGRAILTRHAHGDSRQRLSNFWVPPIAVNQQSGSSEATNLLTNAGYVRQAYAGIFHLLPLGLRVQEKLERLIDKYMRSLSASKVALSSISSQALWKKSDRLGKSSELFMLNDRKGGKFLLAPTHEEEITALVAQQVRSSKQLPVRLYQIGRKYRDEKRPRGGLLRGREFLMKDLYTFDANVPDAHKTYDEVRTAYRRLLDELTIPYVEARADSGDMGGDLSHEYHFPNEAGEDTVITCSQCELAINEEFAQQATYEARELDAPPPTSNNFIQETSLVMKTFLSRNGRDLIKAFAISNQGSTANDAASREQINSYAVKAALTDIAELDTGIEDATTQFTSSISRAADKPSEGSAHRVIYVLDHRLSNETVADTVALDIRTFAEGVDFFLVDSTSNPEFKINLLKHQNGDDCPSCKNGKLHVQKAIEIGHTFHLGTRYSSVLNFSIRQSSTPSAPPTPVEMGCHGIGVSRLIAAVASCLKDAKGLNWPKAIAPFEVAILSGHEVGEAAEKIYDTLSQTGHAAFDAILDDRDVSLPYKMKDADLVGYPVLVILGKSFAQGEVEIQCRRLNVREQVPLDSVRTVVNDLLQKL